MIQLAVNQVEKSFSVYPILEGVSFEVQEQERIGIVGRNGCGKTTLFKLIVGIEKPDKGDIFIKKGAKIGYVEQIPTYKADITVKDVLMMAFAKLNEQAIRLRQLEEKMATLEGSALENCLKKYGEISQVFEMAGGYEIEASLSKICTGFGFSESFLNKSYEMLSGGEKTTVLLAKVLLQNPDILLLDEPTNHLDMQAMDWLEGYLKEYKGAVVIISHDRYFLDQVAEKIIDLDRGKATVYHGNYSYYIKEKERMLLAEFEAYEDQQKKIKAMEKAIKRLRVWANQADNEDLYKKAACMQKRLDKMEKLDKPVLVEAKMDLSFSEAERSGKDVIVISGVDKAFGDKKLFEQLDFKVQYKEHVALVGNNGCGKSTLVKMLLGEEAVDKGVMQLGSRLKIAYLPQQVHFEDEELTVLETFKKDVIMTETQARHTLAQFLFYGEAVFKKVKGLSGGEKSRLLLCKLIQEDVNLLILDEPTNHLDIESRENLEEALQSFNGTLLFISHDRYFINKLAQRVSEVANFHIVNYIGNYDDYREKKVQLKKQAEENEQVKTVVNKKSSLIESQKPSKDIRPNSNGQKRHSFKLGQLEKAMHEYEEKIEAIRQEMDQVATDYEKWQKLDTSKRQLEETMDTLMGEWLELQEE